MESGYDINHLAQEAQSRWLKPIEVFFILKNYEEHQLTHQIPQRPTSGSLYLFNKRVLKFFRKDGHQWRRRRDQRTVAEAHERLKVGNAEALNCYYAHGEENPNFQRRSYWMLDPAYEHIVLVHYRDIREGQGRQNAGSGSQVSTLSSSTFSPSPNSFATDQPDSSFVIGESYELSHNDSSPSSVEISSSQIIENYRVNLLDNKERTNETSSPDLSLALRKIEQQLSLNDDEVTDFNQYSFENEDSNDLDVIREYELFGETPNCTGNILPESSDDEVRHHQLPGTEDDIWNEMLRSSKSLPNSNSPAQFGQLDAPSLILQEVDSLNHEYSAVPQAYGTTSNFYQDGLGMSLEHNTSLTIAQKQKFTIREISPEWCYTSESTKIFIIGSFYYDPLECEWACMIGDIEAPVQIIQEGVLCCHAPAHRPGKTNICITTGNRESCSEVREFEYRAKPNVCMHNNPPVTEANKSAEELLSLVRFVQMLLSDQPPDEYNPESRVDLLGKSRMVEDSWSQVIDALLVGTSTSTSTLDWLLQELLKDKLEVWLSSKLQKDSFLKKEQGIIHLVAGLGFEWALQPILNSGVSINFRDIKGWTALHWAARFGREKMVAALIASGASAVAVTDPNSQDPIGKTPATVAAICGHRGLAGYLSEVALMSHLSSLTLEESVLSKGSAALEAERTINSISNGSSSNFDDQVSLRHTLAAVRNATQAAARIQSAFRAHSFRKRQHREAAAAIADAGGDEYSLFANDISKLAFRNARDHNLAALSIQKKYKGWKGRRDFLSLRQKVVKIQAHVRGYQVRKNYKVCWAVGILEKVILRWRRRGVGLRGYRPDSEYTDDSEDEDILKVLRKKKVDEAIDEAVSRVLCMVESQEAREQYLRILEKYRQAKAELENKEPDSTSSHPSSTSHHDISNMENDEI